ncbi:MAG: hypothetical protein JSW45_10985 [Thiotrichales bacterium]|nr:MAG: hypothetical protein JSW45_10985 [Thiotrichales bacterium]
MVFADITRKQAFSTHLLISMAIFFVLAYLIIFHWYPSYYFHIDGGYRGLATIFFVDVVLGPGLTLLVFKPGKPNLRFDMTMIVIIQVVALTWGVKSVVSERPMLTVFYDGKFSCMTYSDVVDFNLERLLVEDKPPPLLAVLPRPSTHKEYQDMMLEAFRQGSAEIYVFSDKLLPMDVVGTVHVMNYRLDVANSFYGSEEEKEQFRATWSDYVVKNPDEIEQYLYYPMSCRYQKVLAVFDPQSSEIVDYVPVYTDRATSNIKLGFTREELDEYEKLKQEATNPL